MVSSVVEKNIIWNDVERKDEFGRIVDLSKISIKLDELIKEKSTKEVADIFGVNERTIYNWRKQKTVPHPVELYALLRYFNLDIKSLFPSHVSKTMYCDKEYIDAQPKDAKLKLNKELLNTYMGRLGSGTRWSRLFMCDEKTIYRRINKHENYPIDYLYYVCQVSGLPFERLFFEDCNITKKCKQLAEDEHLSKEERYLAALWYHRFELLPVELHRIACKFVDVRSEMHKIIYSAYHNKNIVVNSQYIDYLMNHYSNLDAR